MATVQHRPATFDDVLTVDPNVYEKESKRLKRKQRLVEREARGDNLEFPPDDPFYAEGDDDSD